MKLVPPSRLNLPSRISGCLVNWLRRPTRTGYDAEGIVHVFFTANVVILYMYVYQCMNGLALCCNVFVLWSSHVSLI